MIRKWFNRYMQFSRRNLIVFYTLRMMEACIVALLVAWLFKLNRMETIIITVVGVLLTPVGYAKSRKEKEK